MEFVEFQSFLTNLGINLGPYLHFPPEQCLDVFDEDGLNATEFEYVTLIQTKLKEVYGNRTTDILRALLVLTQNCQSFKNRLNGTIKDEWLTEKNFGSIMVDCVEVLDKLPNPAEWQLELKTIFKSMKPQKKVIQEPVKQAVKEIKLPDEEKVIAIMKQIKEFFDGLIQGQTTKIIFGNNITFHDIMTVYSEAKRQTPELYKHVRNVIDSDGNFILVYWIQ